MPFKKIMAPLSTATVVLCWCCLTTAVPPTRSNGGKTVFVDAFQHDRQHPHRHCGAGGDLTSASRWTTAATKILTAPSSIASTSRLQAFFPRSGRASRETSSDSSTRSKENYSNAVKSVKNFIDPIPSFLITRDTRKWREEQEEWEEEDFLLADVLPKQLVHERDFFRVETRVSAWDEYVIVSILCTSICFSTLTSYSMNPDHAGVFFYEVIVRTATQLVAGVAVLCGIYSTMVFSISILYSKTALGLEQDTQFDRFLDNTVEIRKRAFWSFSYALGLFTVMVVLVLVQNLPLFMNIPLGAAIPLALYVFYIDWVTLTSAAEEVFEDE